MQLMVRYLQFIIICALFCSCTQNETSDILSKAERCMEAYPDSALSLLNQIPHPDRLYGKLCADYALLLTQARDKNYLDSLQSDSLIKLAVDYYQDSDDNVKAGKALLYYGKMLALQGNDTIAMQVYLDAQTKLEKTKEYKMQAMLQEYIGRLNDDRGMYDEALENYQRSIFYFRKVKDTLGIVHDYRNIAWIYEIKQNSDSVNKYVKAGMHLLKEDSLSPIYPSFLQLLGEQEAKNGNLSRAVTYFQSAIRNETQKHSANYYWMSLGDVYLQLGLIHKAESCFENILESNDVFTQSGAYNYLYKLEKNRADYAKALYYKEKSDSLLKIDQDEDRRTQVLALQRKYETQKLRMEKSLLERENQIQFYFWIAISSLFAVLSIFFYFWIKKQYRKIFRKYLRKHLEKNLQTINENEQIIGQYICQIEELKLKENIAAKAAEQQLDSLNQEITELKIKNEESTKEQIAKLNQKIQILVSENKLIREDSCAGGIFALEQLKKGLLIVENMTQKEKSQIFEYMDLMFGGFVSRLKKEYGLNENNLMLAILVKLNFTSNELMTIFQCEKNSIFKKKQRLRDKLNLKNDYEFEKFLSLYPLNMSTM